MCVCDLTEPVGLSQPTVSHHMKLLVEAGLVTREQRGKWAYYQPQPTRSPLPRGRSSPDARVPVPADGRVRLARGREHLPSRDRHRARHLRSCAARELGRVHHLQTLRAEPGSPRLRRSGQRMGCRGPHLNADRLCGVVEHSIYIHPDAAGQGVGSRLLAAFLAVADHAGIWTVQSSIFPENTASLRLHERAGFRTVGRRERIARMDYGPHAGRWRDTILVERRTPADPAGSHAEVASSVNMHTHTCPSDLSTRIFTPNRLQDS